MKRENIYILRVCTIVFTIMFLFTIVTYAHPGRTDSNGGHWDREDGTYHFHTGEYKGQKSSGSSSEYEYEPFVPPYEPPTINPYVQDNNSTQPKKANSTESSDYNVWKIIGWICAILFGLWYIFIILLWDFSENKGCMTFVIAIILAIGFVDSCWDELTEEHPQLLLLGLLCFLIILFVFFIIRGFITTINNFQNEYQNLQICTDKMIEMNKLLSKPHLKNVPNEYEIGEDGLPKEKNSRSWGKTFTVYKTSYGQKIHFKKGCSSAYIEKNIGSYCNYRNFSNMLCQRCSHNFKMTNIEWFKLYVEHNKLIKEYQILKNNRKQMCENLEKISKKCNTGWFKFLLFFSNKKRNKLNELNEKYKSFLEEECMISLMLYG